MTEREIGNIFVRKPGALAALLELNDEGPKTMNELFDESGIVPSTIGEMGREKLVAYQKSRKIKITDYGREIVRKMRS